LAPFSASYEGDTSVVMKRVVYERRTSMLEQLRQVALLLDRMWWENLTEHPGEATISLADASQAVHRALVALGSDDAEGPLPC
jgi:hypothetical protein